MPRVNKGLLPSLSTRILSGHSLALFRHYLFVVPGRFRRSDLQIGNHEWLAATFNSDRQNSSVEGIRHNVITRIGERIRRHREWIFGLHRDESR
ncbi:MAG TPA: hypothetical protein DDW68_07545 [Verrucomicrobiales bacterium]|nr:hypothetical protein [Verrucomicrobiales bacterium]